MDTNKKVCIITDNEFIYLNLKKILEEDQYGDWSVDYFYTYYNKEFAEKYAQSDSFQPIDLKHKGEDFFSQYTLFISAHCKQLFPDELVRNHRCINVHPGFNPYNRGWFPQVFSIINKSPVGVTIHEIDGELDHGPIILQEQVKIDADDTSWSVYQKIQNKEVELLEKNFLRLLMNEYQTILPENEGNINYKRDFNKLCEIDRDKVATYGQVLDYLRAMTFDKYNNAYFYNEQGEKVYVSITLKKED